MSLTVSNKRISMRDYLIVITPLIGLLGVLSGAFLQAYLSRKTHKSNNLSELQNKAYADFLNSASNIAVAQRTGKRNEISSELSMLADAKARICVYGESVVIHELAEFMRHGGTLQTEQEILSFSMLCMAIRESVGIKEGNLYLSDISQLLFSIDLKNVATPGLKNR